MPYKVNPLTGDLTYYEPTTPQTIIVSQPPTDMCRVTNIHVNPSNGKLVIEWDDDVGYSEASISSTPPEGMLEVRNIYVNPTTGKLVVDYDDEV